MIKKKVYHKNPITSYGIICFKKDVEKKEIKQSRINKFSILQEKNNNDNKKNIYNFLIIRRKDSFSFAEFVKAKYNIYNKKYIKKLLENMTKHEITFLKNVKYPEDIWDKLWFKKNNKRVKEYEFKTKRYKLNLLIKGVKTKNDFYNMKTLCSEIKSKRLEPEWGFPKGRKLSNETNKQCSIREFLEETDLKREDFVIHNNIGPFDEIYKASNGLIYRNIYYVAEIKKNITLKINPKNISQISEISKIGWFEKNETISKLRKKIHFKQNMINKVINHLDRCI